WRALTGPQGETIERMADAGARSLDDTRQLLEILNDLAGKRELHESPQMAGITGGDADLAVAWTGKLWSYLGWKGPPASDAIAQVRAQLAKQFDPEQSRRLNKLLIARVFPESLRTERLNLLSRYLTRPVTVRFQVLNPKDETMIWDKAARVAGTILAMRHG